MPLRLQLIAALAALFLTGCGADNGDMIPVTGRITWEGAPVTTGSITFTPAAADASSKTHLATGQIQPDGTFAMSTLKQADGVLPGTYRVAINSDPPPPMEILDGQTPPKGPVPASYADPATSGLEITIESGSDAIEKNFELPK